MRPVVIVPRLADADRVRIEAAVDGRATLVVEDEIADVGSLTDEVVLITGMSQDRLIQLIAAPGLRWLASTSSGVEHIPLGELRRRGVLLTNSAGAHGPAMAEYALGMMIALARGFPVWAAGQRAHRWRSNDKVPVGLLGGKLLGIIGYGAVGRRLATYAMALGMRTWAVRRSPAFPAAEPIERLLRPDGLPELLASADFVVLTANLNASSRHLLGGAELSTIKRGALLVNVARGGLIDEAALVDALRSGRLAGAALDVVEEEPLAADSPLWDTPNVLITPHISGGTPESWDAVIGFLCENLRLYLAGTPERLGNLIRYDGVL